MDGAGRPKTIVEITALWFSTIILVRRQLVTKCTYVLKCVVNAALKYDTNNVSQFFTSYESIATTKLYLALHIKLSTAGCLYLAAINARIIKITLKAVFWNM